MLLISLTPSNVDFESHYQKFDMDYFVNIDSQRLSKINLLKIWGIIKMKEMETRQDEAVGMPVDQGRRSAMRKIAISVGVLASISVLPEQWTRPIIGQIVLPAHAGTSGATLHDPCTVKRQNGDQTTATVLIKVTGFTTPPTANLPVLVTATASGGANAVVTAQTTTSAAGTFEVFMTIGGGPGITSVAVTTTVTGADGIARCSVSFPAPTPGYTTTST